MAPAKAGRRVSGSSKSPWRMARGMLKYFDGRRYGSRRERIRREGGMWRVLSRWWRTWDPRPPVADVTQIFSSVLAAMVVLMSDHNGTLADIRRVLLKGLLYSVMGRLGCPDLDDPTHTHEHSPLNTN
jgi:hypothetical protein